MTSTYIPAEPRPSDTPIWDALVAEHGHDPTDPAPLDDTAAPVLILPGTLAVVA